MVLLTLDISLLLPHLSESQSSKGSCSERTARFLISFIKPPKQSNYSEAPLKAFSSLFPLPSKTWLGQEKPPRLKYTCSSALLNEQYVPLILCFTVDKHEHQALQHITMRLRTARGLVRILKSLYSRSSTRTETYPIEKILQQPENEQPDITEDMLLAFRLQLEECSNDNMSISTLLSIHDLADTSRPDTVQQEQVASCSDAAPSAPPIASSSNAPPSQNCPICLERCPDDCFLSATCNHTFCKDCMVAFLSVIATQTHQYPPCCPLCRENMDTQACLSLLAGAPETAATRDALEKLMLERDHHDNIRYCANSICAAPFEWVDDVGRRQYRDRFRVTCPLCKKKTCVQCRVLWHDDTSCEKYQKDREEADEIARLVAENGWRHCPGCSAVVAKDDDGCNFVKCRCSCGFCYKCGKKYLSLQRTPQHYHGVPDCQCGLFE